MTHRRPEDLFRAEKERALTVRNSQHARLLAEAKAAFDKLMAEGQAARKSGRPRKHPLPPLKTSSSRVIPPAPAPVAPPVAAKPVAPLAATIAKSAAVAPVRVASPAKAPKLTKPSVAAKSAKGVRSKKAAAKPKAKSKKPTRR